MLGSVAVAEVQQILGWRSDKATEILNALIYAQNQREMPGATIPWFLAQEDISLPALTIGSQVVALPTGYIQDFPEEEANLRYRPTSPANARTFFLKKMSYEVAEKTFFGDWSSLYDENSLQVSQAISPGVPKAYVLRENSIRIYPAPDQAYVLTWSYWGADAILSLNSTNQWLTFAPWVLIGEAASKLASDLGNSQALATAQAILQRANNDLFRAVIHRQEAGRRRSMGSRL